MQKNQKDQSEKLLKLVRDIVQQDKTLREQHQIGDKFRFIRDRLQALLARVEENMQFVEQAAEQKTQALAEDEAFVYVYLFNAQGLVMQTWQKMVNPAVFYEYSVNRPIYLDKSHVEAFIRTKPNKVQHGFLTVVIKKQDILAKAESKDSLGNPVVKVKENSLRFEKLSVFTQGDHEYTVGTAGELIKKSSAE